MSEEQKVKYQTLNVRGTVYKTTLTKKYLNRKKWAKADEKEIYSFIPGTATKVQIKPGQQVTAGQDMVFFVAMKMENIIKAPFDGIIDEIMIKEGDRFPKGRLLIRFR